MPVCHPLYSHRLLLGPQTMYYAYLRNILCLIMHPADRDAVTLVVLRHASLCRYTAGVYSHIPGAMAALPKFDEGSDFKIPANVVKGDSDT